MWHRFWCFFGICTHSTLKWSKIKLTLYACHTTSSHTGDGNYYFNRLRCPLQKKNTVAFAAFNWNCTSNAIKRYFNELHIQFIGFSQGIAIKASFPPLPIFFVQLKHEKIHLWCIVCGIHELKPEKLCFCIFMVVTLHLQNESFVWVRQKCISQFFLFWNSFFIW